MLTVPLEGTRKEATSPEMVVFPEKAINKLGQLNLETYSCTGISGLNTYYGLSKLSSFPYVRNNEIPEFE